MFAIVGISRHLDATYLSSHPLVGVGARVIAINVASGGGDGLDATGQAQRIATANLGHVLPERQ